MMALGAIAVLSLVSLLAASSNSDTVWVVIGEAPSSDVEALAKARADLLEGGLGYSEIASRLTGRSSLATPNASELLRELKEAREIEAGTSLKVDRPDSVRANAMRDSIVRRVDGAFLPDAELRRIAGWALVDKASMLLAEGKSSDAEKTASWAWERFPEMSVDASRHGVAVRQLFEGARQAVASRGKAAVTVTSDVAGELFVDGRSLGRGDAETTVSLLPGRKYRVWIKTNKGRSLPTEVDLTRGATAVRLYVDLDQRLEVRKPLSLQCTSTCDADLRLLRERMRVGRLVVLDGTGRGEHSYSVTVVGADTSRFEWRAPGAAAPSVAASSPGIVSDTPNRGTPDRGTPARGASAPRASSARTVIALLPFVDDDERADNAWLGYVLADLLTLRLIGHARVDPVARTAEVPLSVHSWQGTYDTARSLGIDPTHTLSNSAVRRLSGELGAASLVLGSYRIREGQVTVTMRLTGAERSGRGGPRSESVSTFALAGLHDGVMKVSESVLQAAGVDPSKFRGHSISSPSAAAATAFGRGLAILARQPIDPRVPIELTVAELERASAHFDEATSKDPELLGAWVGRALASSMLGRTSRAERDFVEILARGGEVFPAAALAAYFFYMRQGNRDQAIEMLAQVVKTHAGFLQGLEQLILTYHDAGNRSLAHETVDQYLQMNPEVRPGSARYGRLRLQEAGR